MWHTGHAAKFVIKHMEKEVKERQADKIIQQEEEKEREEWIRMRIMWSPSNIQVSNTKPIIAFELSQGN